MKYPDHINKTERQIIDCFIKGALAEGFSISVFGEGEEDLSKSQNYDEITAEVAATGITELVLHPGRHWFQFIHGNGYDVLSDYTVKSEELPCVIATEALAERLSQ